MSSPLTIHLTSMPMSSPTELYYTSTLTLTATTHLTWHPTITMCVIINCVFWRPPWTTLKQGQFQVSRGSRTHGGLGHIYPWVQVLNPFLRGPTCPTCTQAPMLSFLVISRKTPLSRLVCLTTIIPMQSTIYTTNNNMQTKNNNNIADMKVSCQVIIACAVMHHNCTERQLCMCAYVCHHVMMYRR